MNTLTEENYLKAIHKLSLNNQSEVINTNAISNEMKTSASSVTDMLKRLSEKGLINYTKYKGVSLSKTGKRIAIRVVRKHRLWELFLVETLGFHWDEVHDIAEQLEHIKSPILTKRLAEFLNNPKFDPHGDPIPDEGGQLSKRSELTLAELQVGEKGEVVGVKDSSAGFLQYLDGLRLGLGSKLELLSHEPFDDSRLVKLSGKKLTLSNKGSRNIYLKKIS